MRISVVIPSYNAGHVLGRAVVSVLRQALAAEIIVVDDGSTDDTGEVINYLLHEHGDLHGRLRYVKQANAGPGAARNHGARIARGEWVALLDADDYWYGGKLERQTAFMHRFPRAAVYFAGVDLEDGAGRRSRRLPPVHGPVTWEMLTRENLVPSPTPLVHRETFLDVGGFDEVRRLAEDWDLWLRLAERGPLMAQREALACYLDSETGLHRDPRMLEGSWAVLCASLSRMRSRELRPGVADRAFANLLRDESYSLLRAGRPGESLRVGMRAVRHDRRQLPAVARIAVRAALDGVVAA